MTPEILIALIGVVPSLIAAAAAIYSVRVSQGNRRAIDKVQIQTNGLMSHLTAAAEAKGVAEGHAAGVLSGAKAEQNRTKT